MRWRQIGVHPDTEGPDLCGEAQGRQLGRKAVRQ